MIEVVAVDVAAMHALGRRIGAELRAGDVVVLSGPLGAGKTTLTQGIAAGLQVRGPITSPTFVIARRHPSLVAGPALLHVDAYRVSDLAEIDDLDLDSDLTDAVLVAEWGAGKLDALLGDHLLIDIQRGDQDEARVVQVTPVGAGWQAVEAALS